MDRGIEKRNGEIFWSFAFPLILCTVDFGFVNVLVRSDGVCVRYRSAAACRKTSYLASFHINT